MAADNLGRQRRLLLPIALLLASSSAVAGGLTVSLANRYGHGFGLAPPLAPASSGLLTCAPAAAPLAEPDPMAVLAAALGESRNPAMATPAARSPASPLDGLLAPMPAAPPMPPVAVAAEAATPPAPAALPALAAPAIAAGYRLDLGYFLAPDQAVAFANQVQEHGVPVQLLSLPDASGRVWTHVRTPPFAGSAQALAGAERIERALGIPTRLVAPDPTPPAGVPAP